MGNEGGRLVVNGSGGVGFFEEKSMKPVTVPIPVPTPAPTPTPAPAPAPITKPPESQPNPTGKKKSGFSLSSLLS